MIAENGKEYTAIEGKEAITSGRSRKNDDLANEEACPSL